ncbi:uncharacterized protein with FMN-binding domain [Kribbella voronezhensis]|uniref:Uncharacterized protein with FMN-binding domain n=1 Tax=Kribbella voronezhensis TaxID=2512212 RepID=A0A4R7TEZ1_9ACTN|nr:FMN-binding protein [Kribbella voronezhensis]TDU90792.1 uncharacterized protein with FMN-binding domain [Kribbella voronezhensis]
MKRIATWLLSTITVVVLLFGYHTSTSGKAASAPAVIGSANPTTSSGTGAAASPGSGGTPEPSSTASTSTAATTVQGDVADTQWGPVQVQVIVANGKITDVSVLQYPNGNGKDQQINAYALPVLINETLAKQSAAIDMISGATVTSDGYTRSLQSALDKAGL